jgi:hypothetical protein
MAFCRKASFSCHSYLSWFLVFLAFTALWHYKSKHGPAESDHDRWLNQTMKTKILDLMLTGLCSLVLTLIVWVLVVMSFERCVRGYEDLFWGGSLWLSAICCATTVAYVRCAKEPVLGSTIAFAIFSIGYLACEGPLFGNVSQGGDPGTTKVVVGNLIAMPCGVFVASELGAWLGLRQNRQQIERG